MQVRALPRIFISINDLRVVGDRDHLFRFAIILQFVGCLIGGTESSLYDTITFADDTTLAGTLDIEFINKFIPQAGDTFNILNFESANLNGAFTALDLPELSSSLRRDESGLVTTGQFQILAMLMGDANGDGIVDVADLGILGENFNQSNMTLADGDLNGDGMVDVADLGILSANWTASQTTGNASALVPEPAALSLLAVGALMLVRRQG